MTFVLMSKSAQMDFITDDFCDSLLDFDFTQDVVQLKDMSAAELYYLNQPMEFDLNNFGVSLQQVAPTLELAETQDHAVEESNGWSKNAFLIEEPEQGEDEYEASIIKCNLKRKAAEVSHCKRSKLSNDNEDHTVPTYTPVKAAGTSASGAQNVYHLRPEATFSRAPYAPANDLPLSTQANQIMDEFKRGVLLNETPDDFRRRILTSIRTHIVSHISAVGEKICQQAPQKPRLGDFLSRMKGCLRNAGLALYIVENLFNTDIQLDKDMVHTILEHVPPPSTRPATKRVDGGKNTFEHRLGLKPASRETVESFWIKHLKKDNRSFMRQHVNKWPGHWDKLGL